jgi:protease I
MPDAITGSESEETQMDIRGKKIAILVTDGFEQVELTEPKRALEEAGAKPQIVSPLPSGQAAGGAKVKGWQKTEWGDSFDIDLALDRAKESDFDALLLPGGVLNPDKLRLDPKAVELVKAFVGAGKPIAAICHGPMMLIEAGAVKGRKMTSFPSIRTDLKNAGASWVDEEVVIDGNLVTSRKPSDIPAFNREMIKLFAGTDDASVGGSAPARREQVDVVR